MLSWLSASADSQLIAFPQGPRFILKHGEDIFYLDSRHIILNHEMEINKWNTLINWKLCFLEYISSKAKTWISDVRLDKLEKC